MKTTLRARAPGTLLASAALLSVPLSPAIAQEPGTEEIIEEVIVTGVPRGGATKLEASVSVSAVPAEDLAGQLALMY